MRWCWLVWACLPVAATADGARQCPQADVWVRGGVPQDVSDVCRGAKAALDFFARHGVFVSEPLSIEVTHSLPAEVGALAVGCYIETKRRAYLVPYKAFRAHQTWFGVPINRAMYQALATHEAAHAVAACHFQVPHPTIVAKEYLAYAAMWSHIDPTVRRTALTRVRTEGFTDINRFTPMLYLFDPMRFGAEVHRHFLQTEDPVRLIQDILSGRTLNDG